MTEPLRHDPQGAEGEHQRMETARIISATGPLPAADDRVPQPRAAGSPLPTGSGGLNTGTTQQGRGLPSASRALSEPEDAEGEDHAAMSRAMGVLKQAMPYVQRLLPLLEGNVVATVGNLLKPRPTGAAPKVDLLPIETRLTELQLQQTDLRSQIVDQNASLKRVEDQLELVREATDRNTLEQQELMEDLKATGGKIFLFGWLLFAMLILSIVLNLVLLVHIKRVLP